MAHHQRIPSVAVKDVFHQRVRVTGRKNDRFDAKLPGQRLGRLLRTLGISDIDPLDAGVFEYTGQAFCPLLATTV